MPPDLIAKALTALRQKDFLTAQGAIAAYGEENQLEFQHYLIKGLSEIALENWQAACDTLTEATKFFPHQAQLWLNLGIAQENLGKLDEAAESFEVSLDLQKDQSIACGNLSNIYRKQGLFEAAEAMAHRAYELGAPKAQALNSLGLALGKQGKYDAATKTFHEALQHEPTNHDILSNIANLAVDQLHFNEAWVLFRHARAVKDSATLRHDEGMARLLAGDYVQGWPLYEARLELPGALRFYPTCPRYKGEILEGKKIIVVAEQGFGDTLMFCRYGKFLAEQGATLFWVVPKTMQWLLSGNLPGAIIPEGDPLPAADYYLPMMSLPLATGTYDPREMPAAPYLRVATEMELPKAKDGKRKIGLVWAGSRTHQRDHERSLLLDQFAPLFKMKDAQFYAPFIGSGLDEITDDTSVISLASSINDFADTATMLRALDCLVTVDTAVAHLAGAMGIKTYLLLPYCPDWRWGASGDTTPWYKNMTLLRQPSYGDWESVMEKLVNLLAL